MRLDSVVAPALAAPGARRRHKYKKYCFAVQPARRPLIRWRAWRTLGVRLPVSTGEGIWFGKLW
jgi:hypothetical protein